MNDDLKRIRRRVIIVVGGFLSIILILSVITYFATIDRSIPSDVTSLPENSESESSLSVYRMDILVDTPLTPDQINQVNQSMVKFVELQKIRYVSVEPGSVKLSSRSGNSIISFGVKSNIGSTFRVEGSYIGTSNIYVQVFNNQNDVIYHDDFDHID